MTEEELFKLIEGVVLLELTGANVFIEVTEEDVVYIPDAGVRVTSETELDDCGVGVFNTYGTNVVGGGAFEFDGFIK